MKLLEKYFCSTELIGQVHDHLLILLVSHIVLSITAVVGNALILVALYRESSLHPPSKLLYRNLAITDICVGFTVDPLGIIRFTPMANKQEHICHQVYKCSVIISYTLCSVSLLTMTVLSLDRLLALLLGLRYRQVVTLNRTYATITLLWLVSTINATMYLLNPKITYLSANIGIALCLVTSILAYSRIFLTLRHNQIQVQGHIFQGQQRQSPATPLNIARYRKAVSSVLWVQVTVVVCYLPYGIMEAVTLQEDVSLPVYIASEYTSALVYLNSSLNPLQYCWKIKEVGQAVKNTLGLNCCSSS